MATINTVSTWWWNLQGTAWLTDTLPAGTEYIQALSRWCGDTPWCPADPVDIQGDQLIWSLWPMGGDQWNEFYLTVRLPDTLTGQGTVINQAEIASDQPQNDLEVNYDDNLAIWSAPVLLPYFDISKGYSGNAVAGTTLTYTVFVENVGHALASEVVLTDQLPDGFTYLGGGDRSGDTVSWSLPGEIDSLGGMAMGQFWGELSCTVGTLVKNQNYQVISSAQGITSTVGAPVSFDILAPSISVTATASTTGARPGMAVSLMASAVTNGSLLIYEWDFGAGIKLAGASVEHTFSAPGNYDVTVTVTDQCGFTASDSIEITVSNFEIYLPLILRNP